ncbi:MAG: zinc ABC transporter substrate-binding protein [Clostridia bacterium]|nr:zinc ABC transporter substrate-binding protein [Clostridia bacterium]
MHKRFSRMLLFLCLLLLPLHGLCETVTASFFPIYLFARNLTDGIEEITVHSLAERQTGCLHDYQLTSGDLKALSGSDLFLINGAGMESYLDMVFDAFPDLPVTDASSGVELLPSETGETEWNAHIWLDPQQAMQMVRNLAQGLIAAFPQHEVAISENLESYLASLQALDENLSSAISPLPRRSIVTFHEAFPYFARRYDLDVVAVIALEPDEALSTRQTAELVRLVKSSGNPPLFTEPQYTDLPARVISRETGAPVYELDPCVTGPEGDIPLDWYQQVMEKNLLVLQESLGDGES